MKKQKKPPLKSKPAAKKKAAAKTAASSDIQAQLKAINQKLDYLLVRAAPLNREEWHPLVEEAEKTLDIGDNGDATE